uniref:Uncharacterized protein n=1 Tax=Sphenodon punctatus TaxID=8508 RepID=A0A8D0H199_SPHPU
MYRMRSMACLAAMYRYADCLQLVSRELHHEMKNPDLYILRARLYDYFGKATLCYQDIHKTVVLEPRNEEAQVLMRKLRKQAEKAKCQAVNLAIKGFLQDSLLKIN